MSCDIHLTTEGATNFGTPDKLCALRQGRAIVFVVCPHFAWFDCQIVFLHHDDLRNLAYFSTSALNPM